MLPNTSFTGNEQQNITPSSSSGIVVFPVTCAELHNFSYDSNQFSNTSPLRIGSIEPKYVKVIGLIVSSDTSKASWTIIIDDGTSTLEVSAYPDSERLKAVSGIDGKGLSPGNSLSVLGHVRRTPTLSLFALDMHKVEDFHEVETHFLSAVLAYERSTAGVLGSTVSVDEHSLFSPYKPSDVARPGPPAPLPRARWEGVQKRPGVDSLGVYSRIMLSLVSARGSCSREDLFGIMESNGYGDEEALDSAFSELILSNRLVTLDGIHFRATGK